MLSPEPPYPLHGGGAFRITSLAHYFARFAAVDLVLFSEGGRIPELPRGLFRSVSIIPLPVHRTSTVARYIRNARRALMGVPPLIDRLSGHGEELDRILGGKRYDAGIMEHFWCAPYIEHIKRVCNSTIFDAHNIESVLHARCAQTATGLVAAGQRRFARRSEALERELLPGFDMTLVTSQADALTVRRIAPGANVAVYPNALPAMDPPQVPEEPIVVFSGNFEYHPNIDAVDFLVNGIWPEVLKRCPELRLRLVGRGDRFIRHLLPSGLDIETTGAVTDAMREIAAARIVVAPLRAGSGTRVKILEAWAAARAVIATSTAAEGLEYIKDSDLLIEDAGEGIAAAIVRLNTDPARRLQLGAGGRRLFEQRYTWQAAWSELDTALPSIGITSAYRYTEDSDANRR